MSILDTIQKEKIIILKPIAPPSTNEFSALVSKTRKAVKEAGITPKDLEEIIKKARKKK